MMLARASAALVLRAWRGAVPRPAGRVRRAVLTSGSTRASRESVSRFSADPPASPLLQLVLRNWREPLVGPAGGGGEGAGRSGSAGCPPAGGRLARPTWRPTKAAILEVGVAGLAGQRAHRPHLAQHHGRGITRCRSSSLARGKAVFTCLWIATRRCSTAPALRCHAQVEVQPTEHLGQHWRGGGAPSAPRRGRPGEAAQAAAQRACATGALREVELAQVPEAARGVQREARRATSRSPAMPSHRSARDRGAPAVALQRVPVGRARQRARTRAPCRRSAARRLRMWAQCSKWPSRLPAHRRRSRGPPEVKRIVRP